MLEGKLGRGIVNKHILKFPEEGLKQLQFFMEGLSFPVAVAAYTEQDIVKISIWSGCFRGAIFIAPMHCVSGVSVRGSFIRYCFGFLLKR